MTKPGGAQRFWAIFRKVSMALAALVAVSTIVYQHLSLRTARANLEEARSHTALSQRADLRASNAYPVLFLSGAQEEWPSAKNPDDRTVYIPLRVTCEQASETRRVRTTVGTRNLLLIGGRQCSCDGRGRPLISVVGDVQVCRVVFVERDLTRSNQKVLEILLDGPGVERP